MFLALTGHAATADDEQDDDTEAAPMTTAHRTPPATRPRMLRRNLRHLVRYPSLTLMIIGLPVVFLLLFVYVFGGTLGAGLPGGSTSSDPRADYLVYITPAILVMTVVVGGATAPRSWSRRTPPRGSSPGSGPCRSRGRRR